MIQSVAILWARDAQFQQDKLQIFISSSTLQIGKTTWLRQALSSILLALRTTRF
jgi:hypothetical protein